MNGRVLVVCIVTLLVLAPVGAFGLIWGIRENSARVDETNQTAVTARKQADRLDHYLLCVESRRFRYITAEIAWFHGLELLDIQLAKHLITEQQWRNRRLNVYHTRAESLATSVKEVCKI